MAKPEKRAPAPRSDAVPPEVERVEVWAGGFLRAALPPLAPPGAGEHVMVRGGMHRVLSRVYDPQTRTARLEIAE